MTACAGLAIKEADSVAAHEDSGLPPQDTAAAGIEPHVEEESIAGTDDPAGWLFSEDEVHQIAITMTNESLGAIGADPYAYTEADVVIDGLEVDAVGLRLKGKFGSFRPLNQKASFKFDFNYYVPGRSFYGISKLNLNALVVDCSMLREHMSYKVFRDMGLPAERTGWAWVTVNGEPFGLYNVLEQPNGELLGRWYDDPSGNLYDGKYVWYGGYDYVKLDLSPELTSLYTLEEGTDVGAADLDAVASALSAYAGTGELYEGLAGLVDWDQVLTYFAVEQWVGQNDGYVLNRNNYYVYFGADGGGLNFIPWDMDYSEMDDVDWAEDWAAPYGLLAAACREDSACLAAWKARAEAIIDAVDADANVAWLDQQSALIADYLEADPRRECSSAEAAEGQTTLIAFVADRPEYMRAFWGVE